MYYSDLFPRRHSLTSIATTVVESSITKPQHARSVKKEKNRSRSRTLLMTTPGGKRHKSRISQHDLQEKDRTRPHSEDNTSVIGGASITAGGKSSSSGVSHHHQSAWGKVKNMIYTRRDSLKKRTTNHSSSGELFTRLGNLYMS